MEIHYCTGSFVCGNHRGRVCCAPAAVSHLLGQRHLGSVTRGQPNIEQQRGDSGYFRAHDLSGWYRAEGAVRDRGNRANCGSGVRSVEDGAAQPLSIADLVGDSCAGVYLTNQLVPSRRDSADFYGVRGGRFLAVGGAVAFSCGAHPVLSDWGKLVVRFWRRVDFYPFAGRYPGVDAHTLLLRAADEQPVMFVTSIPALALVVLVVLWAVLLRRPAENMQ